MSTTDEAPPSLVPTNGAEEARPQTAEPTYRSILRATSVMGGGSLVAIAIGLARSKGIALIAGPSGLGVVGLLTTVMSTVTLVLGLGLASSSVRLIAASQGNAETFGAIRRALWRSNVVLGLLGAVVLTAAAAPLAKAVFGMSGRTPDVAWLSIGVVAGLVAASQMALLQGLRRTADLARSSIAGAFIGTATGLIILAVMGSDGVRWLVLSAPVGAMMGALWFTRTVRRMDGTRPSGAETWAQWRAMIPLGWVLMTTGVVGGVTDVMVRAIIVRHLGTEAAGYFQAASVISMQYLGLILGAMAADYYPRLAETAGQQGAFRTAVNEQLEVAVLLASPPLLAVLGLAPWMLSILYSSEFRSGADLLRWFVVGDVLKLATWTIGFALLAHGRSKTYLLLELSGLAVFALGTWLLIPVLGLAGAGVAFFSYLVWGFGVSWWATRSAHGVSMHRRPALYLFLLFGAAVLTATVSNLSDLASAFTGLVLAAGAAGFAVNRFHQIGALGGIPHRLDALYQAVARLGRR